MGTVWILGAGFSRSLGGPLLPELFARGFDSRIRAAFPGHPGLYEDPAAQAVRSAFLDSEIAQWRDAEEFLDYLDTARAGGANGPAHKLITARLPTYGLRGVTEHTVSVIAWASRRLLAAECSAFLVGADVETEKWAPYRRWADKVQRGDVVITFNYDLVLEKLARTAGTPPGDKFSIPTIVPLGESYPTNVTVLKLHGSVNWRVDTRLQTPGIFQITAVPDDDYFALRCNEENMIIASPGPTKLATTSAGPLASLWMAATAALKAADAIVFVGYRFPPTDSSARRVLIDAIGDNERKHLVLHTVLGPRVHDDNTERLKSMLTVAARRKRRHSSAQPTGPGGSWTADLNVHPLWAEDFLDLWDFARMYPPRVPARQAVRDPPQ